MKYVDIDKVQAQAVSHNPAIHKQVILDSNAGLNNLVFLSRAVFPPGETAIGHIHEDMTETFFCIGGTGQATINGSKYPLHLGVCLVAEPGEWHEISNTGADDLVLVYFALAE